MYLIKFQVGQDPRPVMRQAYNLFKDGGDPEKVCIESLSFSVFIFETSWRLRFFWCFIIYL